MTEAYDLQTEVALGRAEIRTVAARVSTLDARIERLDAKLDSRPSWGFATWLSVSMAANGALVATVIALIESSRR